MIFIRNHKIYLIVSLLLPQILLAQGSRSIFDQFTGRECRIHSADGSLVDTLQCQETKAITGDNHSYCDNFTHDQRPLRVYFPNNARPMYACRHKQNTLGKSNQRITILIFGDSGTGDAKQYAVARSMVKVCAKRQCDTAFVLGDNIYEYGVSNVWAQDFDQKFETPYKQLNFPFFVSSGNHDYHQSVQAQIDYSFFSKKWIMPNYSFSLPHLPPWLHVFAFDTSKMSAWIFGNGGTQAKKAKKALCNKNGWRFIIGHHPNLSNGSHGNQPMISEYTNPVIRECGVQAFFAGHDHHQEHINANHYQMFVQGAAAKQRAVGGGSNQMYATSAHGFAVLDLTPAVFDITFYDEGGAPLYNWAATYDQMNTP